MNITSVAQAITAAIKKVYQVVRSTPEEKSKKLRALSTRGHQPGRTITTSDNSVYQVQPNGSWVRITPRRHEHRVQA